MVAELVQENCWAQLFIATSPRFPLVYPSHGNAPLDSGVETARLTQACESEAGE